MLRHHYKARNMRLERLIAKAEKRAQELATDSDQSAVGKRVRTMAARSLARHRKSLAALIELYGEKFNEEGN